jgi:hypothetical protein
MIFRELYNWAVTLTTSIIQLFLRQSTSAIKRKTPGIGAAERSASKCPELTRIVFIRTYILDSSACIVTTWKNRFITYNLQSVNWAGVSSFRRRRCWCRSTPLALVLFTL